MERLRTLFSKIEHLFPEIEHLTVQSFASLKKCSQRLQTLEIAHFPSQFQANSNPFLRNKLND